VFSRTASGEDDVDMPATVRGVDRPMVTPQPAGASRVPTHPAVISARLG
jgi:hypothetical protein